MSKHVVHWKSGYGVSMHFLQGRTTFRKNVKSQQKTNLCPATRFYTFFLEAQLPTRFTFSTKSDKNHRKTRIIHKNKKI